MDRDVAEIQLAFDVVKRPRRFHAAALVAGVGAGGRIAGVHDVIDWLSMPSTNPPPPPIMNLRFH